MKTAACHKCIKAKQVDIKHTHSFTHQGKWTSALCEHCVICRCGITPAVHRWGLKTCVGAETYKKANPSMLYWLKHNDAKTVLSKIESEFTGYTSGKLSNPKLCADQRWWSWARVTEASQKWPVHDWIIVEWWRKHPRSSRRRSRQWPTAYRTSHLLSSAWKPQSASSEYGVCAQMHQIRAVWCSKTPPHGGRGGVRMWTPLTETSKVASPQQHTYNKQKHKHIL